MMIIFPLNKFSFRWFLIVDLFNISGRFQQLIITFVLEKLIFLFNKGAAKTRENLRDKCLGDE